MKTSSDESFIARLFDLRTTDRLAEWEKACAENPGLRARLPEIARVLDQPERVRTESVLAPIPAERILQALESALEPADREAVGTRIGPYKLLQKIGEGGFGAVWMAEQLEPIRRRVALKIVKVGMDTDEVIARFEVERQALALMDHPNIARVFDAGATAAGRPYFVMELVRGVAITRYCDDNRLTAEARLRLFISVCQAVQHAHQKGVIHRDLKPSNILVTLADGVPIPKVIDFGIAKATDKQLTEKTLVTQFHAFVGTPAYTSPEQMEMSALDVDTRSDIYSLGVLLYELLAGRPPFDPEALIKSGLDAMRRTIREVDPPRPSTRLRTLTDEDRTSIAGQRSTDPAKLSVLLRGDLDWIAMRCLEKDRTRRYETANALARDIERHLGNEPVSARPPSTWYRANKFVRRHKVGVAAAGAIAVSLVGGLISSSVLFIREHSARKRAVVAEQTATRLQAQAEAERAAEALRASRTSLALAEQLLAAEGRAHEGIAHLVRAARSDPSNHAIGARLVSALAYRSFAQPIGEPLMVSTVGESTGVRYTKDGRHAVTNSRTLNHWDYWDLDSGRQLQRVVTSRPVANDLSPVTTRRALGHRDGTVAVFDYATGDQVFATRAHTGPIRIRGVRFSPDGRWLATASDDRTVKIWDASTGELKSVLQHEAAVSNFGFSPDSGRIATTSGRSWRIWHVPDGRQALAAVRQPFSTERAPIFSPDGNVVAFSGTGRAVFHDAKTGSPIGAPMMHRGLINEAGFSHDGKIFATTSTNGEARLWEVPAGRLIYSLAHHGSTITARFTRDDRYLLVRSDDDTARVWNVKTGQLAMEPIRVGDVVVVDLSPDGTEFMTGGRDGVVRRWRLGSSAARPLEIPVRKDCLAFVRDRHGTATALAVYSDQMLQIDLLSGRAIDLPRIFPARISRVLVAPNWQRASVRTVDGTSECWEFEQTRIKRVALERFPTGVINARFSSDSTYLAATSSDGIRVWNARTGALVAGPFAGASIDMLTDDPFSPDGRRIVAVSDERVIIYDLASGRPVGEPLRHVSTARSPVFSPDGRLIATTCGSNGAAQLWDARTTQPVGAPLMHRNNIMRGVRFTQDGRRLLTWNRVEVCVWDVATGRQLIDAIPAGLDIYVAAFSEDDARIATFAAVGNEVRLWDSKSGQLLSEPAVGTGGFINPPTFHLAGRFLATGITSVGGAAKITAVPPLAAAEPVPEWLLRLATALAAAEIDRGGVLRERACDARTLDGIRRELAALRADAPYTDWGRWILADHATRPLAPGFKITAAEAESLAASSGPAIAR